MISEGEDGKGSEACVGCKGFKGLSVQGVLEGEDGKVNEACSGCKGAEGLSLQDVLPFPLDPRAIATVMSMFACCLAEEKRNKDLIVTDENLISWLSKFD